MLAFRLQTEVCGGIRSTDRVCGASVLQREVCGGIGSVDRGLWWHRVCRRNSAGGIGTADRHLCWHWVCRQRFVGASSLQTEVCRGIGSADGGPLGSSRLQTEVCGDIEYGDKDKDKDKDSGQWGHHVCRQRSVQSSNLNTEFRWGHRVCIQRSLGHPVKRQGLCGIRSAQRGLWRQ